MGVLQRMSAGLAHRGPDDEGLWQSPDRACGFAHRRLAIIDLSPGGHQPMHDPLTGATIVFNGEIYNYRELRQRCIEQGCTFRTESDTEVILALYRLHGTGCLRHLRGMFALAIWDPRDRTLFLARDRLGKKPLNYARTPKGLVFASELWPLAQHPAVDTSTDLDALDLYLQTQSVPQPRTIYKGIAKLPPAHFAILSEKGMRLERYWDVSYEPKTKLSFADALDGFEEKLTEAVRLRMIAADVPLGALLSGGVDSSVVVAVMAKLSSQPVKTFSMGFEEEEFNELPYAQAVAERFASDHTPRIVRGDVHALLPRLARHYGEPFADHSAIPSFLVCDAAREHVTVALNGDGGDELMAGYTHQQVGPVDEALAGATRGLFSAAQLADWAAGADTGPGTAARIARRLSRAAVPELAAVAFTAYWSDAERRKLLDRDGRGDVVRDWRRAQLLRGAAHARSPVDRMLSIDSNAYLPDTLLAKMDIASMQIGLEVRSPLLDHEVIEFCAQLPAQYKFHNGSGKYLLKRYAERYFPAAFLNRPKKGFSIPLNRWLKGPLKDTLTEVLNDPEAMAPLNPVVVRENLASFLNGGAMAHYGARFWTLLQYGIWRREFRLAGAQQPLGRLAAS
jgi:asparagine synthase (glutamine-hydrolysing)